MGVLKTMGWKRKHEEHKEMLRCNLISLGRGKESIMTSLGKNKRTVKMDLYKKRKYKVVRPGERFRTNEGENGIRKENYEAGNPKTGVYRVQRSEDQL